MNKLYSMPEDDECYEKNRTQQGGSGLWSRFDSIVNKGVRVGPLRSRLSDDLKETIKWASIVSGKCVLDRGKSRCKAKKKQVWGVRSVKFKMPIRCLSGNVNWTIGYMGLGFRGGIQATDVKCRSHWTFLDSFLCNCKDVLFCLLLS